MSEIKNSTLRSYETLMLIRTTTIDSQLDDIEAYIGTLIEKHNGSSYKIDRWGRTRLAYPVEHRDYGYYTLLRFQVGEKDAQFLTKEINKALKVKFNPFVIRHVTMKLEQDAFDRPYKKPEATATAGKGHESFGAFGKEHTTSYDSDSNMDSEESLA